MDPSILLDTFSAEDIDIWQSYNLFVDDNINSSIKEQIKEENTDLMDCCFSSICPNDLINNVENDNNNKSPIFNYQNQYSTSDGSSQLSYDNQSSKNVATFGDEFYSTNSSSCSSSPSIESNQYFEIKQPISMHLDNNYQQIPHLTINNDNNFQQVFEPVNNNNTNNQVPIVIDSTKVEFFQINNNLENETLLSPSSSTASSSLSSSTSSSNPSEFNQLQQITTNNQLTKNPKKIQKLNEIQQQQPIIIVEAAKNNKNNNRLNKKSANILPPSPPSSFGSDSESNQSTASSINTKLIGQKSSKLLKASKLNMRNSSSTVIKQMRHQPYSFKQAHAKSAQKTKVTIKTESILDTSNSLLNLSTNSDDDCWPFLCSLSVSFVNLLFGS